ncbi:MAG: hypothetical protein WCK89_17180 [bacterium]
MSHGVALFLATAAAGLIAGAGAHTFVAASIAAAAAVWLTHIARPGARTLYANLDPQNPDSSLLLDAFQEALALIRHTRQPVRLRIAAFTRNARPIFRLNVTREADLELSSDTRRTALKQPGIWLPDHPLPLTLPHDRSITLLLEPCGPERVRASLASTATRMPHWCLPLLLAAVACALDIDWLLAATLGFAFQTCLVRRCSQESKCIPL